MPRLVLSGAPGPRPIDLRPCSWHTSFGLGNMSQILISIVYGNTVSFNGISYDAFCINLRPDTVSTKWPLCIPSYKHHQWNSLQGTRHTHTHTHTTPPPPPPLLPPPPPPPPSTPPPITTKRQITWITPRVQNSTNALFEVRETVYESARHSNMKTKAKLCIQMAIQN